MKFAVASHIATFMSLNNNLVLFFMDVFHFEKDVVRSHFQKVVNRDWLTSLGYLYCEGVTLHVLEEHLFESPPWISLINLF